MANYLEMSDASLHRNNHFAESLILGFGAF